MPSETKVTYNGVVLDQTRIIEYSIDNGATADNPTVGPYTHVIRGEALVQNVAGEGNSNENFIFKLRGLLNQPRRPLEIKIDSGNGPDYLAQLTGADERGGPFFRANITEITGTSSLLVNFTAEWTQTTNAVGVPFEATNPIPNLVRSFYTTAQFTVDQTGRTTIRKTGSLQLKFVPKMRGDGSPIYSISRRASDQSGFSNTPPSNPVANVGDRYGIGDAIRNDIILDFLISGGTDMDHADFYRRIISGNLYRGFRRVRQEYAIDESRCRLMFDITDEESFRGLPAPAKVADCNYAFRRALGDDGAAMGQKMFSAEIEGDKNVSPGALLTLAIRLSQNRIDYAEDLITEIKVAEVGMLTRNAISFEVMALATSIQNYNPTEESSTLVPDQKALLLKNILTPIQLANNEVFKFQEAQMPDEYGASLIVRVTPGAYSPLDGNYNWTAINPSTIQLKESNPAIYLFPDAVFDAYTEEQLGQGDGIFRYIKPLAYRVKSGPNKGDLAKTSDKNRTEPTLNPKNGVKYTVHTGIVECPGIGFNAPTVIFQVGAPRVEQTRYSDGSRKNTPPENQIGDLPVNSQVARRSVSVTSGQPDVHGNRVFSAGYDETVCTRFRGDLSGAGISASDPNFKSVDVTVNGQTVSVLQWVPSAVPLPDDPNQGTSPGFTYPNYNTIQFGTNGAYA